MVSNAVQETTQQLLNNNGRVVPLLSSHVELPPIPSNQVVPETIAIDRATALCIDVSNSEEGSKRDANSDPTTKKAKSAADKRTEDEFARLHAIRIKKRDKRCILTSLEEVELVEFLKNEATHQQYLSRDQTRAKVVEIVANQFSKYRIPTTHAEKEMLRSKSNASPSDEWFVNFFARHDTELNFNRPQFLPIDRMRTYTKENVELMFNGPDGLHAVLLKYGIMNADTGMFDPRRLLNMDETPEFVDHREATGGGVKPKVIGLAGQVSKTTGQCKKESFTANCTISCDGFLYGPHYLFKCEKLHENHDVTEKLKELNITEVFTNKIIEESKISTYCTVSATEHGVQTAQTLAGRLDILVKELQGRSITLPVVLMIDGHKSRLHEIVAEWFNRNKQSIIPFLFLPNTSTWSQPLDKMNKEYHRVGNIVREEYKELIAKAKKVDKNNVILTQQVIMMF
jgi:hypothetical protein